MPRAKKKAELRVILDTNALFTGSANYFVRKEVSDLVAETSKLPDLQVDWYIPSVVRDERQFQMLSEAQRLLEPVGKLERLLGHNLNITSDIVASRVREAIAKQMSEHTLNLLHFDKAQVDWDRLISDAAFRRAPFQTGEKEKGFRDAIILETFLQLARSSPTSPAVCRLVLVSGDDLLRTAAEERTATASNVYVLDSVESLKGLLNTLGSAVDERFIASLLTKADKLFFNSTNKETLYYKWDVNERLRAVLKGAAVQLPPGADSYNVDKWFVNKPRFVSKQGQRVTWASRFTARLSATKKVATQPWQTTNMFITSSGSLGSLGSLPTVPAGLTIPSSGIGMPPPQYPGAITSIPLDVITGTEQRTVKTGAAHLDVTWSTMVTTRLILTRPALIGVGFVEALWD